MQHAGVESGEKLKGGAAGKSEEAAFMKSRSRSGEAAGRDAGGEGAA